MISTPAARICGPPIPKIATSMRCRRAAARRAAYMSPEASPAERRSGVGGICSVRGDQSLAGSGDGKAEPFASRSEEHTSELQSHLNLVCRLLLEKKKK